MDAERVGDIDRSGAIEGNALRVGQTSGNRCDITGGRNFTHRLASCIGDIEIAEVIDGDSMRVIEACRVAFAIHKTRHAGLAGDGGDASVRGDLTDYEVIFVGDIGVARFVHGYGPRIAEMRVISLGVLPARIARRAGQESDGAFRTDFANGVAGELSQINVSSV